MAKATPRYLSEQSRVRRQACRALQERGELSTKELQTFIHPSVGYNRFLEFMDPLRGDLLRVGKRLGCGNLLIWRWPTDDDLKAKADALEKEALDREWLAGLIPFDPEPKGPAEWQEAVDAAHGALSFDDCRMYGLLEGGPAVDRDRCFALLARGKRFGYAPTPGSEIEFAMVLMQDLAATPPKGEQR